MPEVYIIVLGASAGQSRVEKLMLWESHYQYSLIKIENKVVLPLSASRLSRSRRHRSPPYLPAVVRFSIENLSGI